MIRICEISNGGVTTFRWLCDRCAKVSTWAVKPGAPVGGPCDDCEAAHQASPGYITPTPVYVLTSPDARLCTAAECPPPRPIAPWAKPAASKQTTNQGRAA